MNLYERFKRLGMKFGDDSEGFYVVAMNNEGWTYSESLRNFNSLADVMDYLHKQESLERGC